MEKRVLISNLIIIMCIITIIAIIIAIYLYSGPSLQEECIDPSTYMNMRYDVCYGILSKNLLITIIRGRDIYNLEGITMSFADQVQEKTEIRNLPIPGETKSYKIFSSKNPGTVEFSANVLIEENINFCTGKTVAVRVCNLNEELNITGNISTANTSNAPQQIEIIKPSQSGDSISSNLVNNNGIWEPICKSNWNCMEWEECLQGLQKRYCEDKNSCFISTNIPDFTRNCDNACKENWQCQWSSCINGNSIPSCIDKNSCGTEYSKPKEISCEQKKCTPDLQCGNWSKCKTNYNLIDLNSEAKNLGGIRTRLCEDKSNCASLQYETQNCSLKMNIYSRETTWCNKKYIEIYDKATGKVLSRIKEDTYENIPLIEISLDMETTKMDNAKEYCDYCFNGVKDNDEQEVDCGGSCKPCIIEEYKKDILSNISNWLRRFFGL